ncbi:MAG: hypothetical protein ACRDL7_08140, partial [Gaiellaceae bacterium]
RVEGIDMQSIANSTTQYTQLPPVQSVAVPQTTIPMSMLSLPPGMQPTDMATSTNMGSVINNMMNSSNANPNRTVNVLRSMRLWSGTTTSVETSVLLDSGADTCLVGKDFYIENKSDEVVHVVGFQDHMKTEEMRLGMAITAITTTRGETILLRVNHAILGVMGNSLLSTGQTEDFDHCVDSRPCTKGGKQRIYSRDVFTLPLQHLGPHMYLKCCHPTDAELPNDRLPVIELTSPMGWDPDDVENVNTHTDDDKDEIRLALTKTRKHKPNWEKYQRCLGYKPLDVVKATLAATTQYARDVMACLPQREHYKPQYRGLNCACLHETVATDTLHSSVPAIGGEKCAQLYLGKKSTFT